ncbi:response regulator with CheY-like receiver domain and winged-helix DNA-binding domain [Xenococcus sp. PCC 7305]|uniref:response regulator transcription factor n=1 Tax=Xenococcus sp. PCC 7305 TaxID=102125 RepID=UPI0002ABB23B|nr:response regulator [Xenococcus sp. PCC 7305]ELS03720.1 response regulator with CheY-like receiver domain and winged-helix DNA-binding domain [Xenococcus sp. PCC 7305]
MNNILIAEDETRIAAFMEKGLKKNGFQTAIASDGEQVLSMMQSNDFDLLLLDLGLPVKDGWQVLQELKNQGNEIPIIVVSAYDNPEPTEETSNYVTKPFRFQDLLERIKSNL